MEAEEEVQPEEYLGFSIKDHIEGQLTFMKQQQHNN